LALSPGTRLGPYEILSTLGVGGMGEVYRAHDPRLGRDVALKILPASTANDPQALARFTREARAVAALNHPHIVTIFSTEEADGVRFLTMELIEGRTLDLMIPKGGVSLTQFFDVSIGLADALSAAHQKEITHRDLKPANVMVADSGRVKVLDFGLARAIERDAGHDPEAEATRLGLTQAGTVLGTAPYMSPEQIEGKPLDGRSDIFSLGIVMYEMAIGTRPFGGDSSPALMASIIKDRPTAVAALRSNVPDGVSKMVSRCLEKNPGDRVQSAHEVLLELKALRSAWETPAVASATLVQGSPIAGATRGQLRTVGAAVAVVALLATLAIGWFMRGRGASGVVVSDTPSIAVLPFVDMSANKDQEYFSDGISEELLNVLAKIPALRVTSRSSAFSFKGRNVAIPDVGKRLNVGHVLEGSVRKSGNTVRITAQLIDARTDTHVWSETYDRPLNDIFAMQDEIAAAVVAKLKVALLGTAPKVRQADPRAYELYLQAAAVGRRSGPDRYEKSIALLQQALAIDPSYGPGWVNIAQAYAAEAGQDLSDTRGIDEGFRLAREAANKAVAIDPEYPWSYTVLANVAMKYDSDLATAARHLEHALTLDPRNPGLMLPAATLLQSLGRQDEAVALREYAIARDPLSPFAQFNLGITYLYAGRSDDAIAACRTSLKLAPKGTVAHYTIGLAQLAKHDASAALAEMQQETSNSWKQIGLPMVYHALGRTADADAALATLIKAQEKGSAFNIASVLAFRGESNRAFEWLEKSVAYRDPGLSLIVVEPLLAGLHVDPRWLPFLRKIGKAPEQLAAIKFNPKPPKT
jgi:TolB-like protein/Flp pilus assembly protein TadD